MYLLTQKTRMKITKLFFVLLILFSITSFKTIHKDILEEKTVAQAREFYQIKTYIFKTEQQVQTTEKYLK